MTAATVAAIDLGASSGRVVTGHVDARRLDVAEVHRFSNDPVGLPDGLHWDVLRLHHEILEGLRRAGRSAQDVSSVGIDSWGVDYGLLDDAGTLLGDPFHYRDARHADGVAAVHGRVPVDRLYARNGLQELPFNTVYQLAAARQTPSFAAARSLLLMPDLFAYWLTGVAGGERTNASTTGLVDASTGDWSVELIEALDLPNGLFPALRRPGEVIGPLRDEVATTTGLSSSVRVTAVGSHDTASAVVGVPAEGDRFAYIASGTWSLVGLELERPVLTEASRLERFTNEAGVDGRIRYLHNVMGLWLLQECMRAWEHAGTPEDLGELLGAAAALPPGGPWIDPDDGAFLAPGDMPRRIEDACRQADRPVPTSRAALARCILDSLAQAYARTLQAAARLAGRSIDVVHIVGGGARNTLLCQLTADACELPVVAGPVEATAVGNILVQARGLGAIDGDLETLRALIRATHPLQRYAPRRTRARLSA